MVRVCQPILYCMFDFVGLVFSLLPNGRPVVSIIFVCVECQKGGDQHCKDYYDCGPH
jgi:hypothetical protein